jgi:hypothetical protein
MSFPGRQRSPIAETDHDYHDLGDRCKTHMCRQKGIDDTLAVAERDASLVVLPVQRRVRGVGPYQVVEQSIVWHVFGGVSSSLCCVVRVNARLTRWSLNSPDVIHALQTRAETTVHAEDLARDDGGDGQGVEHVDKRLPRLDVCASLALIVEPVH